MCAIAKLSTTFVRVENIDEKKKKHETYVLNFGTCGARRRRQRQDAKVTRRCAQFAHNLERQRLRNKDGRHNNKKNLAKGMIATRAMCFVDDETDDRARIDLARVDIVAQNLQDWKSKDGSMK